MALSPCAEPGCPDLTEVTYCPAHRPKAWASSNRRSQLPRDWNARVRQVLRRDPICTICGIRPSTEVHHTQNPDDHRLSVLAGVDSDCHKAETARQSAKAKRGNR
jgi:5-methylcytosine-specific restriction protein A